MRLRAGLTLIALWFPATATALDGPITRLATVGGRPEILARADGSAVAVWEDKPTPSTANVHFCRIAAGDGTCAVGSEKTLASAAGATTSKPFVFDISGGRIVVVHGGCCPQRTYRWLSTDGGATFGAQADFASIVPFDQGATAGPGDSISILGDPAGAGTVGYQLANPTVNSKTTQEAVFDTAAGLSFAQAVGVDPATGRPFALWASSSDGFAAGSPGGNANVASSWTLPAARLAGTTGMRAAGALAVWARDGHHEVAKWTGSGFAAAVPLPGEPANIGKADIARDANGGVHVVYSPSGTGDICYAFSPDETSFGVARLLGRDPGGVSGLQVSATGASVGRVAFSAPGSGGPVSVLALSAPPLMPNTCASPPTGLALAKLAVGTRLRAAVDPAGQDATFHIEYGPTTAYGASTPETAIPAAGGPMVRSVDLGLLAPAGAYHARLVAANASGTATSADLAFTTPAVLATLRARQLIRLPARCRHRRVMVGFRAPAGVRLVRAVLRGTGRKHALRPAAHELSGGRVALGGLARRAVVVRVALRLADGRIVRASHSYARCTA